MSKILVMTDLHMTEQGQPIIGLDPAERLAKGLAHAARHHPDADHLVVMGDLTHHGRPAQYERLKPLLEGLPWPYTLMLGNHDHRDTFREAFPDAPDDGAGFVQSAVELPDVTLLCLDTYEDDPDPHASGRLCGKRLEWFEAQLEAAEQKGALVFMHHPPADSGFTGMDEIALTNREDIRPILEHSPAIRHIFAGHIHRTITISMGRMPVTIFKGTCHQMPMLLSAAGSDHSVDEPGAYGIVLVGERDIVVHFEDFTLPETPIGTY